MFSKRTEGGERRSDSKGGAINDRPAQKRKARETNRTKGKRERILGKKRCGERPKESDTRDSKTKISPRMKKTGIRDERKKHENNH